MPQIIRKMFKKFYPKEYKSSAFVIDYEKMYQKGYRGILFDIDNTLVPHDAPVDERSIKLFRKLRKIGFTCCFISNNNEERVRAFNEEIGNPYIYSANKPSKDGFYRGMKAMGTKPSTTFVVGDQLFTDMWGARNAGIHSILVKPIHPKEKWTIVLKRQLEKIVLFFYKREQDLAVAKRLLSAERFRMQGGTGYNIEQCEYNMRKAIKRGNQERGR